MTAEGDIGGVRWLCLLTVLFSRAAWAQDNSTNSSCPDWSFNHLSEHMKVSEKCFESFTVQLTDNQIATTLDHLRRMTDILQKHHKSVCRGATPVECPSPTLHSKGGLVCVSIEKKRYCKPMCNEGYDFAFLRKSRLFEECSNATKHKWTTQYVGGSRLAVCNKSNTQVSGAASAYFPKDRDCLSTKSDGTLEKQVIKTFVQELSQNDIKGNYTHACLLCG
ncbi:uncharacterized protein LOC143475934 [Brachyhypopomus gauderio]|uniref:uncharacterized protein LOC143475934 n=1 Tax=Brachyhypopomus gauderio TaxID=698409 RepID=UPI0040419C52